MSHQQVVPPETFYAEDLEKFYRATRIAARIVNVEQRWRLAETMKQFIADAQPFRFMDLIPELRNMIYEYCVQLEAPRYGCYRELRAKQPAITKTCRQMRKEALPLYYVLNKFEINVHNCDFRHFIDYIDTIRASGIRSIADVDVNIMTPDNGDLQCGDALTPLMLWWYHGAPELKLLRFRFGGAMLGKDRSHIGDVLDAIDASTESLCYPKCEAVEIFQRWLEAKNLKCRGEECKRDADAGGMWCSKAMGDS